MPITFEFSTANRIIFQTGSVSKVPSIIQSYGTRTFVLHGKNVSRVTPFFDQLRKAGIEFRNGSVEGEPTTSAVGSLIQQARQFGADVVVGIGGGSVIDSGKALAAMLSNDGELMDYLEVVGKGKAIRNHPVPYIAIPTTAGTGSEVTRNAVLTSEEHRVKVSMRHLWMLPEVALIDPALTYSMPPEVTASTGLDALTQVIEPFVSRFANPVTDAISKKGIKSAARFLKVAFENGRDADARANMAFASMCGGLALANAKLGAVHGFAGPVGGFTGAPHGLICARLLPHVMEANVKALHAIPGNGHALERFDIIGKILTGQATATADDAVEWLHELCDVLNVPSLDQFGLKKQDIPMLVEKAQQASSMKGNPVQLSDDVLASILEKTLNHS